MNYIIVGLGNPGQEYEGTRHNTGRIAVDTFAKKVDINEWTEDKKIKSETAKGKVGKNTVLLIKPNTFMNKSGDALKSKVQSLKSKEQIRKFAETLVVVHDDLDIPLGKMKMSFNKSSGGHRGVESIIKAIKTEAFIRLRIGISSSTASGKIKKTRGKEEVEKAILGKFKPNEQDMLKKIMKKASEGLEVLVLEGKDIATGMVNSQ
jgi:PTH1 family peptidyl-tRNA hydrolase